MFDWLTFELARMMAIGASLGAAIKLAIFVSRDWKYQTHRWQHRDRIARGQDAYFEELRELEGYRPHAVTQEERDRLVIDVAIFGGVGALMAAHFYAPDAEPYHIFFILMAITLGRILWILVMKPPSVVPHEGDPPPTRWQEIRPALWDLAAFAFFAFLFSDLAREVMRADWFGGTAFNVVGLIVAVAVTAFCLVRLERGPPDNVDAIELSRWESVNGMMAACGPLALVVFGALLVF